MNTANGAQVS